MTVYTSCGPLPRNGSEAGEGVRLLLSLLVLQWPMRTVAKLPSFEASAAESPPESASSEASAAESPPESASNGAKGAGSANRGRRRRLTAADVSRGRPARIDESCVGG